MNIKNEVFSAKNLIKAYNHIKVELNRTDFPLEIVYSPLIQEIDLNTEEFFSKISNLVTSGNYYADPIEVINVPKSEFKTRNIAIIGLIDRVIYHCIFNYNTLGISYNSNINKGVSFSREINENSTYFLKEYSSYYHDYIDSQIKAYNDGYQWRLFIDIERFYDQIQHDLLFENFSKLFNDNEEFADILTILKQILEKWFPERIGIPQGPDVSHIYSHIYLNDLDKLLYLLLGQKDIKIFRYQDDIVVMSKSEFLLKECFYEIDNVLKSLKLNVNNKTSINKLKSVVDLEEKLINPSHSGSDKYGYKNLDIGEIENLVIRIINREPYKDHELSKLKYFLKSCPPTEYPFNPIFTLLYSYLPHFSVYISRFYAKFKDYDEILLKNYIDIELENLLKNSNKDPWTKYWVLRLLVYRSSPVEQKLIINLIKDDKNLLIRIIYILLNSDDLNIEDFRESDNSYELINFAYTLAQKNETESLTKIVLRNVNKVNSKDLTSYLWLISKRFEIAYSDSKSIFLSFLDGNGEEFNVNSKQDTSQNLKIFNIINNIIPSYVSEEKIGTVIDSSKADDTYSLFNDYKVIYGEKFIPPLIVIDDISRKFILFDELRNDVRNLDLDEDLIKKNGFKLIKNFATFNLNSEVSLEDKKNIMNKIPFQHNGKKTKYRSKEQIQRDFVNFENESQKILGRRLIEPIKSKRGYWKLLVRVVHRTN